MNSIGKRIEWIDIFKGLAIILVVIGHATGLFNAYIYQFHVAAFFFISGWVAKFDETTLIEDTYKKLMKLIVPLLTMVMVFGVIIHFMDMCGIYKYFWQEGTSEGVYELITNFLKAGTVVDILGASWFVVVLFFASVLSHFLYVITKRNKYAFIIASGVVYIVGYYKMRNGYSLPYGADIAFVAQGYYGIGFVLKCVLPQKLFEKNQKCIVYNVVLFIATSIFMYLMNENLNGLGLMNMANREMNSLGWTALAITNGIIWLYALSQSMSLTIFRCLKSVLIEIGKNTMGIMLLHFSFFRIVSWLLFVFGKVRISELKNLVPSIEVSNRFWVLYVLIAIAGSMGVWKVITGIPVLRQLLGMDARFIKSIYAFKPINEFLEVYYKIVKSVSDGIRSSQGKLSTLLTFLGLLIILFGCRYVPNNNLNVSEISGAVQANFPYNGKEFEFKEGWLDQGEGETYRWVEQESIFVIPLSNQSIIRLSGYIPEGIDISRVDVYLNDLYIIGDNISGGQSLELEGSISEALKDGKDVFKIVFNGERVPAANDADQRVFSAMFTTIEIK